MVSKQNYSIIINKHIAFKFRQILASLGIGIFRGKYLNYELATEMKTTCSYQINNSTFPSE